MCEKKRRNVSIYNYMTHTHIVMLKTLTFAHHPAFPSLTLSHVPAVNRTRPHPTLSCHMLSVNETQDLQKSIPTTSVFSLRERLLLSRVHSASAQFSALPCKLLTLKSNSLGIYERCRGLYSPPAHTYMHAHTHTGTRTLRCTCVRCVAVLICYTGGLYRNRSHAKTSQRLLRMCVARANIAWRRELGFHCPQQGWFASTAVFVSLFGSCLPLSAVQSCF